MSRIRRHRNIAKISATVALAYLSLSAPSPAIAETSINVRGWTHDSYGRLVLDRAVGIVTGAEVKDGKLIISFSEPVTLRLDGALPNLKGYITRSDKIAGTTVELALAQPATIRRFEDEKNLVIDLSPVPNGQAPDEQEPDSLANNAAV